MRNNIKRIVVKFNLLNIFKIFFYIFRVFKIKNNKIIFVNFSGKGYGDNPKYILETLNMTDNDFDFVWLVNNINDSTVPDYVRKVKIFSVKSFYELSTAKVWINNSRFDQFISKRNNQLYIQTWHGGLALKKIEFDAEDKLSNYYKKVMYNDNEMIDIMLSNSDFCTKMYKRAFRFNGHILEYGSPRNDILIDNHISFRRKIFEKYNIDINSKIILYAPTFRNEYYNNPYDIDFESLIDKLNVFTGENWRLMIKLHPRIKNASLYINNLDRYIDATSYPDVQELIKSCDILITDYSSTMFEALIANKPVFIYANDIDNYNEERGMYFKFEELPFPLACNNNELQKNIEIIKEENILLNYDKFKEKIGLKETGECCNMIKDKIIDFIGDNNE